MDQQTGETGVVTATADVKAGEEAGVAVDGGRNNKNSAPQWLVDLAFRMGKTVRDLQAEYQKDGFTPAEIGTLP
ncbi:MAG: hypothetical protein PHR36_03650 [Patescibacteria group bacterium]|nr:hypothetical protein [Patescibacteria group bacterium]